MRRSAQFWFRKVHRYLGLVLGVQFMLWTVGGLYFSWSNMEEIHGDLQKEPPPLLRADEPLISPQVVLAALKQQKASMSVVSLQLIDLLGTPTYQVIYQQQPGQGQTRQVQLADALTGRLRSPLTKAEAVALAQSRFRGEATVEQVTYLTQVSAHHEYRASPLPVYAVRFTHPSSTTVYVASELGTVQKFRNQKWRVFDFLWMLHTMDYQSRDQIGNVLLRGFSVLGLLTIVSGFLLFYASSSTRRKRGRQVVTHPAG